MIAVVTGGRDHVITDAEARAFCRILAIYSVTLLRHGAARGVDVRAAKLAVSLVEVVESWPARWRTLGRSAGPIRNRAMLDGPPPARILIGFPGGTGTADCTRAARDRRIHVLEVIHHVE